MRNLSSEFSEKYGVTNLKYFRLFFKFIEKGYPVDDQLTWSHYKLLLPLKDPDEIKFYIDLTVEDNLSKRALVKRIKSNEYCSWR